MPFSSDTLGLPDSAFGLLRDLIHERTGLFYDQSKSEVLTDKLSPLVIERGFGSFLDYYYLLKYDPAANQEWKKVIDALSVQETYFWREMDQVRAVADLLVPQHFSTPRAAPLRIWSAACATGEEPLTIAMALQEKGWFHRAPVAAHGGRHHARRSCQRLDRHREPRLLTQGRPRNLGLPPGQTATIRPRVAACPRARCPPPARGAR